MREWVRCSLSVSVVDHLTCVDVAKISCSTTLKWQVNLDNDTV